jgi:hypothetical protein
MRVLLVGRTQSVIDDVIKQLGTGEVEFATATSPEGVEDALAAAQFDQVIIGGGLDLDARVQIVRRVFEASSSTTVHMNSPSGPDSYLPFVSSVLRGRTDG